MSAKIILLVGAVNGGLCVILGAFGSHALQSRLTPEMSGIWSTAVQYHFYHALGLLLLGTLALHWPASGLLRTSAWLMLAGIVLFSGSLYLLALTGSRWLGAITPLGGAALIAAWVVLCLSILRS
ncbi:MAG: DUF423 domain-containing protein [Gammaproteobacteria bacterium]|nr:DUF423 domain-containing protein [Gammaproteobacteria bacterium]